MIETLWLAWSLSVWIVWASLILTGIYLGFALFRNSIDFLNSRAAFLMPIFFLFFVFEIFIVFPGRLEWFYFFTLVVSVIVMLVLVFIAMYLTRRIWEFIAFAVRLIM